MKDEQREQREGESLAEYDERRADENEADCEAMDGLAAMLNEYHEDGREWDHAEICNELVKALRGTGRTVHLDDDEPESVEQLRSEGR